MFDITAVHLNGFGLYVISRAQVAQSHQRRFRRWLSNRRINVISAHHALIGQALSEWKSKRLYLSLDTTVVWKRSPYGRKQLTSSSSKIVPMNRTPRLLTTLCFLASTVAFGASAIASATQGYADADNPYLGRVEAHVEIPGTPSRRESGSASAYFTRTENGQTSLVVLGRIREDSDNGFTADGIESESGWSSLTGDLTISNDGIIIGTKVDHPNRYRYDGFVSEERFNLEVEHELLEENEHGVPSGAKVTYRYTLSREVNENANGTVAPEEGNGDRECRRTVWQTRNVANLSGGPMIMIRVPVCVE